MMNMHPINGRDRVAGVHATRNTYIFREKKREREEKRREEREKKEKHFQPTGARIERRRKLVVYQSNSNRVLTEEVAMNSK